MLGWVGFTVIFEIQTRGESVWLQMRARPTFPWLRGQVLMRRRYLSAREEAWCLLVKSGKEAGSEGKLSVKEKGLREPGPLGTSEKFAVDGGYVLVPNGSGW